MNQLSADLSVNWRERLNNAYAIHNAMILRPELPVYLVEWNPQKALQDGEKELDWMDLARPINAMLRPQHFESFFGKDHVRDQHYHEALTEAALSGKTVIKELYGAWDLFHPLPVEAGLPRAIPAPAPRLGLYRPFMAGADGAGSRERQSGLHPLRPNAVGLTGI